jgi:hypothetical protein
MMLAIALEHLASRTTAISFSELRSTLHPEDPSVIDNRLVRDAPHWLATLAHLSAGWDAFQEGRRLRRALRWAIENGLLCGWPDRLAVTSQGTAWSKNVYTEEGAEIASSGDPVDGAARICEILNERGGPMMEGELVKLAYPFHDLDLGPGVEAMRQAHWTHAPSALTASLEAGRVRGWLTQEQEKWSTTPLGAQEGPWWIAGRGR